MSTPCPAPARRWYRGNLHMHSLWSDGMQFPELAARAYKDAGYHFIAFTEHDRFQVGDKWVSLSPDTYTGRILQESGFFAAYQRALAERTQPPTDQYREVDGQLQVRLRPLAEYRGELEEPGRFLILSGEEVTTRSTHTTHWVNVINAPAPIGEVRVEGNASDALRETVARATALERLPDAPVLVSLNHPNYLWNATAEDIIGADTLTCFEIHTALNCTFPYGDAGHPGAERLWDRVLAARLTRNIRDVVYGLATDDCHAYYADCSVPGHERGSSMPCRAWVMVEAAELTPTALMTAIRQGRFYASTGVSLAALEVDGRGIRLSIEGLAGARYRVQFLGTRRDAAEDAVGEVLAEAEGTEARYAWRGDELYVRAHVRSDQPHPNPTVPGDGTQAWTQPIVPGILS